MLARALLNALSTSRYTRSERNGVMRFPDENLFDEVVLNLGPLMAMKVVGVVLLLTAYVRPF